MSGFKFVVLVLVILPTLVFSQKKSKISGHQVNVTTNFNYNPISTNYSWEILGILTRDDVDLQFLTPNSGIFEAEMDTFDIINLRTLQVPDSKLNLGFSLQVINAKQYYHNIQLSNISITSTSNTVDYKRVNILTPLDTFNIINDEILNAYLGTFTYEFGKYFGNINEDFTGLGIGLTAATVYNKYSVAEEREYLGFRYGTPSTSGQVFNFNLGLSVNYWVKVFDSFALEFAFAPYYRLGSVGNIVYNLPTLPLGTQRGKRSNGQVEFNYFLRLGLKYKVKKYKKRRRR